MRSFLAFKLIVTITLLFPGSASAEVLAAVASNFSAPMQVLVKAFEQESGFVVKSSYASSGKLEAMIRSGAPFQIFLSGDTRSSDSLLASGLAQSGSEFVYAIGRLVLWSPADRAELRGTMKLEGAFKALAIANPDLTPYGRAAKEALVKTGQWERVQSRIVYGENVAQTFTFIKTGAAELGFVAFSQVIHETGEKFLVPEQDYTPILQKAVLLKKTASPEAKKFLVFLTGAKARRIIQSFGYEVPR